MEDQESREAEQVFEDRKISAKNCTFFGLSEGGVPFFWAFLNVSSMEIDYVLLSPLDIKR